MKTGKINFGKIFNFSANENSLIALSPAGKAKSNLPNKVEGVAVNEDVSSRVSLHALAAPANNQKGYFNIPDTFNAAGLLGWYKVAYEDGVKEIIPIQYGLNILGYNPGGKKSLDKREGDGATTHLLLRGRRSKLLC
jgi:hypothetical protein